MAAKSRKPVRSLRPRLLTLEDRTVPATFTVTTGLDVVNANDNPRYADFAQSVRGLVFFGTPHEGGNRSDAKVSVGFTAAAIAKHLGFSANDSIVEALTPGSAFGDFLRESFRHQLDRYWIVAGLLYGVALWGVMYWIVLPLRFASYHTPSELLPIAKQLFSHCICVGLPIAFIARRR